MLHTNILYLYSHDKLLKFYKDFLKTNYNIHSCNTQSTLNAHISYSMKNYGKFLVKYNGAEV